MSAPTTTTAPVAHPVCLMPDVAADLGVAEADPTDPEAELEDVVGTAADQAASRLGLADSSETKVGLAESCERSDSKAVVLPASYATRAELTASANARGDRERLVSFVVGDGPSSGSGMGGDTYRGEPLSPMPRMRSAERRQM